MRIAVIGLGKIGLPLACLYAGRGYDVVGVDIDQETVQAVNSGREPFPGETGLAEHLDKVVPAGRLRASTSYAEAVPGADVIVVVVPLFVDDDGKPDFTSMDSATADIAKHLSPATLVVYETTLPVGTTRTRWKPALEAGSGLVEGRDFHVAFSPERVLTGRVFADLRKYPKLVGGLDDVGSARARSFYEAVLEFDDRPDLPRANGVWDLGSAEAAEMTKLAETTYRDVNIALANQFALFAQDANIDVHQVIAAANSQPYSHIHQPGVAVGGHCIPVYPRLYLSGDPSASVVSTAREVNARMPLVAVLMLERAHGPLTGQAVVILGAAYRGGVKETAFSGVFPLVEELERRGAHVTVHDPLYTDVELNALGFEPHALGSTVHAALLHTDHAMYAELVPGDLPGAQTIVDGRNVLDPEKFVGIRLVRIGQPSR